MTSFFAASAFLSNALWFSATLFLTIGLAHLTFVVMTEKVSFAQACFGRWEWDRALEVIARSMNDAQATLADLTPTQIDQVFDDIDSDKSGSIDPEELREALEKMGMKLTTKAVAAMVDVVDDNNDGCIDREEFHVLVKMATLRKQKSSTRISVAGRFRSDVRQSSKLSETSEIKREDEYHGLPRTYEEALPPGEGDNRAVIVTETKHPYPVVGVNKPWEDLCGYKSSEAVGKSMSGLIQGPKTNTKGLKDAMDELKNGAVRVECTTVNYRKDGSMFNNHLTMAPLECNAGNKAAFYVGILKNIGDLAQDLSDECNKDEKKDGGEVADDNFEDDVV